jgi:Helix-turn-helix domain
MPSLRRGTPAARHRPSPDRAATASWPCKGGVFKEGFLVQQESGIQSSSHTDFDALAAALAERLDLANGSPWMNTAEAADYMRVSVRWLRQHLRQVPHSKVEGRLFFSRKELDAWLSRHRRS